MNGKKTDFIAKSGLLAAFAIASSVLETFVPSSYLLPPGMKVGFSNIATMIAAKNVSFASAFAVTAVKSVFVLLTRGFTAFLLSLAGGLCSTGAVILIFRSKKGRFGCVGAGVVGAAVHNAAQVAVYSFIVGKAIFWYLPYLLVFGTLCGVVTGLCLFAAEKLIKK